MGNNHRTVNFDVILDSVKVILENATGIKPKFKQEGGT
jgi:hypothetical protein